MSCVDLAIFGNGVVLRSLATKIVARLTLRTEFHELIISGVYPNTPKYQGSASPSCFQKGAQQIQLN